MATVAPKLEYPLNEAGRLAAIRRYDVLDTPPDGAFERVTRLAARLLGTPIAIVSIVDEDRIWFKSRYGLDVNQIDRDPGLCASAILQDEPWIVEDARNDPRTLANPLVASKFGLQFYAGAPLKTQDGFNLGTLCVIDRQPRHVTEEERRVLVDLAAIVIDELELRLAARNVVAAADERLALGRQREVQAMQLNDDVVQSLAVAKLALDMGEISQAASRVESALEASKRLLSQMGEEALTLRRDSLQGGERATA
ncbi:MAG: GAF domain-containing protein [Candidatus Dormiibacterota bacterium]